MGVIENQVILRSIMAGATKLPHDRGDLLWTAEEGVSRMLLSSMDRWVTAILADDGIDSPAFGSSDKIDATIAANSSRSWSIALATPLTEIDKLEHRISLLQKEAP